MSQQKLTPEQEVALKVNGLLRECVREYLQGYPQAVQELGFELDGQQKIDMLISDFQAALQPIPKKYRTDMVLRQYLKYTRDLSTQEQMMFELAFMRAESGLSEEQNKFS